MTQAVDFYGVPLKVGDTVTLTGNFVVPPTKPYWDVYVEKADPHMQHLMTLIDTDFDNDYKWFSAECECQKTKLIWVLSGWCAKKGAPFSDGHKDASAVVSPADEKEHPMPKIGDKIKILALSKVQKKIGDVDFGLLTDHTEHVMTVIKYSDTYDGFVRAKCDCGSHIIWCVHKSWISEIIATPAPEKISVVVKSGNFICPKCDFKQAALYPACYNCHTEVVFIKSGPDDVDASSPKGPYGGAKNGCPCVQCINGMHECLKSPPPPPEIQTLTQKAGGIHALRKSSPWGVSSSLCHTAKIYPQHEIKGDEFPLFARPCPVRPRHGFVDSRIVRDYVDVENLIAETKLASGADAWEIVFMKYVESSWSAIITPAGISIGTGNDGATAGHDSFIIPAPSTPSVIYGWLEVDAESVGIKETPYIEIVSNDACAYVVQIRDGPAVSLLTTCVPDDVSIKAVVRAEGDLLAWESKAKEFSPGTIVWHPGGTVTSHYAVHCVQNGIPITCEAEEPKIGAVLKKSETPKITEFEALSGMISDADDFIKNRLGDEGNRTDLCTVSIATLHAQSVWGDDSHLIALRAAGAVACARLATAACIGEMRYGIKKGVVRHDYPGISGCGDDAKTECDGDCSGYECCDDCSGMTCTGNCDGMSRCYCETDNEDDKCESCEKWDHCEKCEDHKECDCDLECTCDEDGCKHYRCTCARGRSGSAASRETIYDDVLSTDFESLSNILEHATSDFSRSGWSTGYGGHAWAECARQTKRLVDSLVTFTSTPNRKTWGDVVEAWNRVVNVSHNNGKLLTKFGMTPKVMGLLATAPAVGFIRNTTLDIIKGLSEKRCGIGAKADSPVKAEV